MSELKPCQCGAEAEYVEEDGGHWVVCHNGHETAIFDCKEDLLEFWNTRPTEDALQARITELEKAAVVWHKYPDEKPEKPNRFTGMWMNVLAIDECGCIWIGTCRFIGNELDLLAPQTTKYWAYLPEAPKGEK